MTQEADSELGALSSKQIAEMRMQGLLGGLALPFYFLLIHLAFDFVFRYKVSEISQVRNRIRVLTDHHDGPVIWASNHLTHFDPWLLGWVVFPWTRLLRLWLSGKAGRMVPRPIGEETIHRPKGMGWRGALLGWTTYLGRTIYINRAGEDESAMISRDTLVAKTVWVLQNGGSIGFFPEARRSRSGWLDASDPKSLAGMIAAKVPDVGFLCFYLRGEAQRTWSEFPAKAERFRVYVDWIPPSTRKDESHRDVARRVFSTLGRLQDEWFSESNIARNCSGNAIIDVKSDAARALLTGRTASEPGAPIAVLKSWCAKEAALRALVRGGVEMPGAGHNLLEQLPEIGQVVHLPTRTVVPYKITAEDEDKIHAVAVLRGGRLGDIRWKIEERPPDQVSIGLSEFVAEHRPDLNRNLLRTTLRPGSLPEVELEGHPIDLGVSTSASGRYAAYSMLVF